MSLSESITLKAGGTIAFTGASDVPLAKLEPGRYINTNTTADQPYYLTIKSNVKGNGQASDYLIRLDGFKNPPAGSPAGTPDSQISVYMVARCDYGQFTSAELTYLAQQLGSILTGAGMTGVTLDKVWRGEK